MLAGKQPQALTLTNEYKITQMLYREKDILIHGEAMVHT